MSEELVHFYTIGEHLLLNSRDRKLFVYIVARDINNVVLFIKYY
jgi:hypothetical protein